MHPKLADDCPKLNQLALKLVDLGVSSLPLVGAGEALDPLNQHAPVPRAVENAERATRRQPPPESVEVVTILVVARRCRTGVNRIGTRIEFLGEPLDSPALASGVPALKHDHHRALLAVDLQTKHVRLGLEQLQPLRVILLVQAQAQVNPLEHTCFAARSGGAGDGWRGRSHGDIARGRIAPVAEGRPAQIRPRRPCGGL